MFLARYPAGVGYCEAKSEFEFLYYFVCCFIVCTIVVRSVVFHAGLPVLALSSQSQFCLVLFFLLLFVLFCFLPFLCSYILHFRYF